MWEKALKTMERYRNMTIYVGCSGGIDSMVLVHFLYSHQFNIHVLHVNYHKRGKESDDDMEFVRTFCKDRKIPFDVRHYNENSTGNFQQNARTFRYDFFREFASKDSGVIALAHHADDQVETFFMNLMRQSGIVGLASIPEKRENVIRPFLHVYKYDLYEYAGKNQIEWREDKSNQSTDYLRNKWRLEFIPRMEKVIPNLKQSVHILVNAFQETQKELEAKIKPVSTEIFETKRLSIEEYNSFSETELFELWRQLNQPSKLFSRFLELKHYSRGKFIETITPFGKIVNEGAYLSFSEEKEHVLLPRLKITPVKSLPSIFSKSSVYLNPDKIHGELKLRRWQQGDKISPVGVKGKQLVSQIIKDSKIPHSEREKIIVVHDDKNIHWVVNLKIGKIAISQYCDTQIIEVKLDNTH